MKNQTSKQKGQSLIEMVFSIGIVMLVVIGLLALTTVNTVGQKENEFQVIANNLARESIEVIRSIRDSNWLAGVGFNTSLPSGEGITPYDVSTNRWRYIASTMPGFTPTAYQIYLDNGFYNNSTVGELTIYQRRVVLEAVCQTPIGSELVRQTCDPDELQIGVKATAVVTWDERGRSRRVALEDILYGWR